MSLHRTVNKMLCPWKSKSSEKFVVLIGCYCRRKILHLWPWSQQECNNKPSLLRLTIPLTFSGDENEWMNECSRPEKCSHLLKSVLEANIGLYRRGNVRKTCGTARCCTAATTEQTCPVNGPSQRSLPLHIPGWKSFFFFPLNRPNNSQEVISNLYVGWR